MERNSVAASAVLGVCVGLGLAIAGALVGDALVKSRAGRHVTVKGLAEREVDADLAIWPIAFKVAAQELTPLQKQIDERREVVASFLESAGFDRRDISFAAPRITDMHADGAPGAQSQAAFRYVALAAVTVQSKDVALVKRSMEQAGTLVSSGVMLAQDWENRPQFLFTGLNAVKPAMIEEATIAAREAAAKFAKDSGSRIGKIRTASQGLFSVSDRDPSSPERKVVRVVSTIEYFLED
jgi:hypothetical protein